MASVDLYDAEQPIDPKLVLAIEAAFRRISLTPVQFATVPRAWSESNPDGGTKGPQGLSKAYLRLTIAKRDGARCAYCAQEFVDLDDATLDHVIPNCIVGHWDPWNLVLACGPCNNLKADRVPAVMMPVLCHLLRNLSPVAQALREQQKARKAEQRREKKRRTRARARARFRERITAHRIDRQARIEALAGYRLYPAIEAPRPRLMLTAGGAR